MVAAFYLTAMAVQAGLVVLGISTNGLDQPTARKHRAELVHRISLVAKAARVWVELPDKPAGCA